MKRIALLAAAAVLMVQQASASPWLTSLSAAQKKAKEHQQLIFVDLFADWCGWCHQLEQQVFPSQAFQSATDGYVLLRLNTEDHADGSHLAQQFGVTSLPTSLLLTHDMLVAGAIRGFLPPTDFAHAVTDVETRYKDFKKRAADESSIATDYQKRLGLALEFRSHYALPQSESRFKKLAMDPKAPEKIRDSAYYELALTQAMEKKFDDSLRTLREFANVQSAGETYERSRLLAGEVYIQQGNYLGAVNELKSFKAKFPNSPLIQNVDMMLPQIERQLAGRVQ